MADFRYGKKVEQILLRNSLRLFVPIQLVVCAVIYIAQHQSGTAWWPPDMASLVSFCIVLTILLATRFYSYQKQLKRLRSFVLSIENNLITREQQGLTPRSIYVTELSSIVRYKSGDLLIKSKYPEESIYVSKYIDNKDELERCLSEMMPIEDNVPSPAAARYRWLFIIGMIAGLAAVFGSENKWLVGTGAIVIALVYGWSIVSVWRNKAIDRSIKRRSLVTTIFVIFILLTAASKIWGSSGIMEWLFHSPAN